ncbi:MAG: cofactor-independent phosphoglycerate mutase [Candidatus Omnitrophica bacterium]|nr:cofactor-independent phosphoglycerate mutase [Candidatus Omnitrophota bacterium]MBU1996181.1 cofactor-independent phosphoglycerate mutase [Candidatus Omnitrophota bacterium]
MKYIIIVPDGMHDRPLEELDNKTPLEVARTTNMDFMASNGFSGLVRTIPEKMNPGSDTGNMSLLGYNPNIYLSGRASLEAANMDIALREDEVAFRCNLVTAMDGRMDDYSAGHISSNEASLLIETLNEKIDLEGIRFYPGKSYRHILVLKVRTPSDYLKIQTIPPHDILGKEISKYLPKGPEAEMLLGLMEQSRIIFEKHPINKVRVDLGENPANMIWLWGQGAKPALPLFSEKYGVKGSIISAVDLVNGIGKVAGLEIIDVPGITGYYDTNYLGKAEYALKSLKKNDFVFIHIEAPDEAGHNGDFKAKIEAIENIDKHVVGTILNNFSKHDNVRILIASDHATPVELRTHSSEPVGFVMFGKGIAHDGSTEFSETSTQKKGVKFENGEDMMNYFINKFL